MASSRKRKVSCVSLGERPKTILEDTETVKFVIYNFEDKNLYRGGCIESPVAEAHGYKWSIQVYPRGDPSSSTESDHISCFLKFCQQQGDVTAKGVFRCKHFMSPLRPRLFSSNVNSTWGRINFLKRNDVLDSCLEEDGSLIIEAYIQIAAEIKRVWYPEKLLQQDFLVDLYQDATSESSDTVFSVGGKEYAAHKLVLSFRCKKLYDLAHGCNSGNSSNSEPIPIHSVKGEIFKAILDFVYTVKTPEIESEGMANDLLVASDLFDCIPLKLYAESVIVDKFLNAGNAAEWLLFADSHSCALLKEAAMNLFVAHAETVQQTEAWSKVEESPRLVLELLRRTTKSNKPFEEDCGSESEINRLDVTALREKLQQANLELDGCREVLVDRLKTKELEICSSLTAENSGGSVRES